MFCFLKYPLPESLRLCGSLKLVKLFIPFSTKRTLMKIHSLLTSACPTFTAVGALEYATINRDLDKTSAEAACQECNAELPVFETEKEWIKLL